MERMITKLMDYFPKYSVTITIDVAFVMLASIVLLLCTTIFFLLKHLFRRRKIEINPEFQRSTSSLSEPRTPVSAAPLSSSRNTDKSNSAKPTFKKLNISIKTPSELDERDRYHDGFGTPTSRMSGISVDTSVNTTFDLEEFLKRLLKSYFIVYRLKDDKQSDQKKRLLKVSPNGELLLYKNYQFQQRPAGSTATGGVGVSSTYIPSGSPYIKLPLCDFLRCIICEDDNNHSSFILEFKQKTLQLKSPLPVDNNYLIQGFQCFLKRYKYDKNYLENWKQGLTTTTSNSNSNHNSSRYASPPPKSSSNVRNGGPRSPGGDSTDDLDFGSIYSLNSRSDMIVEDIDTRLTKKRLAERKSLESQHQLLPDHSTGNETSNHNNE
jgi:hypothetical protein